jgi:hypothetical protein
MNIYKLIKLIILIFSLYILYTAVGLFFESGLEHTYSRGCQKYLDFTSYSFHYSIFLVINLILILIYIIILNKTKNNQNKLFFFEINEGTTSMKIFKIIKIIMLIFSVCFLFSVLNLLNTSRLEIVNISKYENIEFLSYVFHYSILLTVYSIFVILHMIIWSRTK